MVTTRPKSHFSSDDRTPPLRRRVQAILTKIISQQQGGCIKRRYLSRYVDEIADELNENPDDVYAQVLWFKLYLDDPSNPFHKQMIDGAPHVCLD